ncbi:MAG: glycosyltransferase family 4 protein [Planctomycetaceae bacterium]|nr:glycosyltransferase family 4 protein [Planctomycetaceae bacterium]
MLSILDQLQPDSRFEFLAFAPPDGPLQQTLRDRQIPVIPFTVRTVAGQKRTVSELVVQLNEVLQQHAVDLLHANSLSMSRLTGACARSQCEQTEFNRTQFTGHLRDLMKLSAATIRDLNANHALVAVSHATRTFHVAQGLETERCAVIHNGVDCRVFHPPNRTAAECPVAFQVDPADRNPLPATIPGNAFVVLTAGQICLRKGLLDVAQAMVRLIPRYPQLHWLVAGARYSDKAESREFEDLLRQCFAVHGLQQHLHLPGICNQMQCLMQRCQLLVHGARQEPFGRVLLEAAASGLPIVATDVGGTGEMLRNETDALLVKPNAAAELAQAIECCLLEPAAMHRRACSARERIRNRFSVEQAAQAHADFWLDSVIRQNC